MSTGQRVVLAIFYVFYPIFLRSRRETFVSPHYYFAWPIAIYLRNKSYLKSTANFEMRTKVNKSILYWTRGYIIVTRKGVKNVLIFYGFKIVTVMQGLVIFKWFGAGGIWFYYSHPMMQQALVSDRKNYA